MSNDTDTDDYIPKIDDVLKQSDKTLKALVSAELEQESIAAPLLRAADASRPADESAEAVVDEDFDSARESLRDLNERGSQALKTLMTVAAASDNPRAFEVVSGLIKTLADVNKDRLEIHQKKKEIKQEVKSVGVGSITQNNNTLMVGSTEDAMELLEKMRAQAGISGPNITQS